MKVRNPQERAREEEVELLADTDAIYSIIRAKVLDSKRIEPRTTRKMRLADGGDIERRLEIAELEVKGEVAHSTVVFGEDTDTAVLGSPEVYLPCQYRIALVGRTSSSRVCR